MADKIIVLDGGYVSQIGTPLELYDRPRNSFVASFIGSPSMNLLPAEAQGDETALLEDGQRVKLPVRAEQSLKVLFGIRPEHLSRADDHAQAEGHLSVQVSVVEPTGAETLVASELGGSEVMAALKGHHALQPGENLTLAVDANHTHVFDAVTGRRMG